MSCEAKNIGTIKINRLLAMMRSKKYVIYTQPYKLNIIGIRNAKTEPNKFDDEIFVIWKDDKKKWNGKRYAATTDPSTVYLKKGGYNNSTSGTAILPQGQYLNKWTIRGHGKTGYKALGQGQSGEDTKLCVYRDYDRNSTLDFNIDDKKCGHFGINIHRAKKGAADDGKGNTKTIGLYSAGCQVFQNYYCFLEFMEMAEKQKSLYGNSFSYTLFDLSLKRKFIIKRTLYTSLVIGSLALIGYGVYLKNKNK
jgi:hypothetical protein